MDGEAVASGYLEWGGSYQAMACLQGSPTLLPPVLPWKLARRQELTLSLLLPPPFSPSLLLTYALFSSLLYLPEKYRVSCFSCAYRSRKGMCYLFIHLLKARGERGATIEH